MSDLTHSGTDSPVTATVETGLLQRVRDALGTLEATIEDGRGVGAAASALLRATREALARLEQARREDDDVHTHAYRSLIHRILEAAARRPVRLAFDSSPFAADWTALVLRAVLASDYATGRLFFSRSRALGNRTLFLQPPSRQEARIPWTEAEAQVIAIGRALLAMRERDPGAGPVALLGQNSSELALLDLACLVTGVKNVPVPANSSPSQIEFILRHSGASALFLGDASLAEAAAPALRGDAAPAAVHWLAPQREGADAVRPFTDFLELGGDIPPERVREAAAAVRCSDIATVMYTSGTTGHPKGIPFTHGNLVTKRYARAAAWPDLGEGDVFLCYLPLYHTFGRWLEMLGCVFWGSMYAFVDDVSIESLLHSFQSVRPTTFISVPKKWLQIAESVAPVDDEEPPDPARERKLAAELVRQTGGRLRRGLSAAGYLPPSVFRRFHDAGIELHSGFGMTEATGGITMTPAGGYRDDSIGLALPGIELSVAEDGELLIRGPYVTPPAEDDPLREEGWLATGDIVRTDAEGHLQIIDRKKEIFKNLQGETISPRRIESLFADFDSIERVLVVGDRRPYCTALIVPSAPLREEHAAAADGDALESAALREHFAPIVETVNRFLSPFERIVDYTPLSHDLDPETELTAKGTPKRKLVAERYADLIEGMYLHDQTKIRLGDIDCRLPHWFFRYTGLPSREVRAGTAGLVAAGRTLAVRRAPDGRHVIVGDFEYDPGDGPLLLGEIFGRARLWLGNEAVREFAGPGIEHWWRRGRRTRIRTRVTARPPRDDVPPPPPREDAPFDVLRLHATARALSHRDPLVRAEAVDRLGESLRSHGHDAETLVPDILLSTLGDVAIRTRALRALVPALSPDQLDEVLASHLLADPDFLANTEAQEVGQVPLRPDQLDRLIARVRTWFAPEGGAPAGALDRLLGYLVWVAVEHPRSHLSVRSMLVNLSEAAPDESRRQRVEECIDRLVPLFRRRLPTATTAEGVSWEMAVEFVDVDPEHRPRILDALRSTKVLAETMALLGPSPWRELRPLVAGAVRVRFLGTGTGRAVHLLEWSPDGLDSGSPRFECILKVNRDLPWSRIQEEIRMLVRARTGGSGRPVVKTQGGGHAEHGLWTEEFVPGRTLGELVAEWAAESGDHEHLRELWPFLVSSAAALAVDFWWRTGQRVSLARPRPAKVILPDHDWQVGGRLVSIADRVECERLADVLASVHVGIVLPLVERFPDARLEADWPHLLSAALEMLGEEEGCRRLEEEADALDPESELARAIRRFLSSVRRHGFLPERVRVAARRYRRWAQLNPDATLEAQASTLDQMEEAYGLGDLDRERPGSRLQFFRHTVFRRSGSELAHALDELIAKTLAEPPSRAELHRQVTRVRENASPSEADEFFLARMLYPHLDPRGRATLLRDEDAPGGFDTGIVSEHRDAAGEPLRIRRPANPTEIAALARVFRTAGLRRMPSVERDDLLVVIDERERVVGGLNYRRVSDTYVRLDWLALSRHRRGHGLGGILIREFLERMRAQGVRVVSTGFFRPAFFAHFDFGVDPRYAGLTRFLTEPLTPRSGRDETERER